MVEGLEVPGFALCALGNLTRDQVADYIVNRGDYCMEPKLDGVRVRVSWDGQTFYMYTRNNKQIAHKFPHLLTSIATFKSSKFIGCSEKLILDGELVAENFRKVTAAVNSNSYCDDPSVRFVAFDVLSTPGNAELHKDSYQHRLAQLVNVGVNSGISITTSFWGSGAMTYYDEFKEKGVEGVVLKRKDAPYAAGRSNNWLRSKYTASITVFPLDISGERTISCGVYGANGTDTIEVCNLLVPDDDMIVMLSRDLKKIQVEIEAYGISQNNKLRHPIYKGLRFDTDTSSCTIDQLEQFRIY